MQVQTPFYVIKRTSATKAAAEALADELSCNSDSVRLNLRDMIDFCFSGTEEEKVFLFLGDKVRLKENNGWRHYTPTSGEAVLAAVEIEYGCLVLRFEGERDFNAIRTDNMDISAYVELI